MNQLTLVKDMTKNLLGINQYDVGQSLKILTGASGVDLSTCIMQWSYAGLTVDTTTDNRPFIADGDTALTVAGVCRIPDAALAQAGQVTGYIYQTIDDVSETVMTVTISPTPRAMPSDYVSDDNVVSLTALIQSVVSDMAPSGVTIVTSFDDLPETANEGAQCGVFTHIDLVDGGTYKRLTLREAPDMTGVTAIIDGLRFLSLIKNTTEIIIVLADDASCLNESFGTDFPENSTPCIVIVNTVGSPIFIWVESELLGVMGVNFPAGWNKTALVDGVITATQDFIMPVFLDYTVSFPDMQEGEELFIMKVLESKYMEIYTRYNGEWIKNVFVDETYNEEPEAITPPTFTSYQAFEDTDINREFISSLNANQINLYNAGVLAAPLPRDNAIIAMNKVTKADIETLILSHDEESPNYVENTEEAVSYALSIFIDTLIAGYAMEDFPFSGWENNIFLGNFDYDTVTGLWTGQITLDSFGWAGPDHDLYTYTVTELITRTNYQINWAEETPS